MTIQQLSDSVKAKQREAALLFNVAKPTREQALKANALAVEINSLKQQISTTKAFDENKKDYNSPEKPINKGLPVSDHATIKSVSRYKTRYLEHAEDAHTLGLIFLGYMADNKKAREALADKQINTHAMGESDNTLGGALVPTEISSAIINLAEQYGVGAAALQQEVMGSDTKEVIRFKHGLAAYWAAEKATFTATDENYDRVGLTAKKLYVYSAHSVEVEEDSIINLGDAIAREMARQGAFKTDDAIFNGDGTNPYGGIYGIINKLTLLGSVTNVAGLQVAAGNTYASVTLANLVELESRLPQYAFTSDLAWYCSRSAYGAIIRRLITSASVGGLTATELINGLPVDTFLGHPVRIVQVMPRTEANSQVCILLGDLSQAAIFGKRSQVIMARDVSKGFDADLIYLKSTWRLDVAVHSVGNASATVSARQAGPVVGLITAAF